MNTTKTFRLLPVTFGVLAMIAAAPLPGAVRAKEPKPAAACAAPISVRSTSPAPTCAAPTCATPARTTRTLVAEERAVPVLSQIPYLGRLFKNVTHHEVEQIGVDFDFEICPDCPQACKVGIPAGVCQSTARPQLFVI